MGRSQYGLLLFPHRNGLPVYWKHHSRPQRLLCLISMSIGAVQSLGNVITALDSTSRRRESLYVHLFDARPGGNGM
jgi:hypothetical protein